VNLKILESCLCLAMVADKKALIEDIPSLGFHLSGLSPCSQALDPLTFYMIFYYIGRRNCQAIKSLIKSHRDFIERGLSASCRLRRYRKEIIIQ